MAAFPPLSAAFPEFATLASRDGLMHIRRMCNVYSITTSQAAILQITRALRDVSGNLPPLMEAFPNYPLPIVRNADDGVRELVKFQWGMPTPPERMKGKADYGTTNIRRPNFRHWLQYLGVEHRCIVPVTSFAEPSPLAGDKDPETGVQRNTGLRVQKTDRCSFSPGCGRLGTACGRSRTGRGISSSMGSSRRILTVSSRRSMKRRCLSF